jgi:hypothetical protein
MKSYFSHAQTALQFLIDICLIWMESIGYGMDIYYVNKILANLVNGKLQERN